MPISKNRDLFRKLLADENFKLAPSEMLVFGFLGLDLNHVDQCPKIASYVVKFVGLALLFLDCCANLLAFKYALQCGGINNRAALNRRL